MRFIDKDGIHYEMQCDVSMICDSKGCHKFYSFPDGTKFLIQSNKERLKLFDYVKRNGRRLEGSEI